MLEMKFLDEWVLGLGKGVIWNPKVYTSGRNCGILWERS